MLASDGTRDHIYLGGIDLCKTTGSKIKPHVPVPAVSSSFVDLSTTSDDPTVPAVSSSSVDLTKPDLTIDDVWGMDPSSPAIVSKQFDIGITVAIMHRLKGPNELNDEIINFYFGMIIKKKEKVFAFNTYFMAKLLLDTGDYDYDRVSRWSKKFMLKPEIKLNPFELDKLFVPIHLPNHWTFIVVYFQKKVIHYYDSMHGEGKRCRDAMLRWLEDEAGIRGITFDLTKWNTEDIKDCPSQKRDVKECGVFTLMSAAYLSDDTPLSRDTFGLGDMPHFRRQIGEEILRGSLDDPSVNDDQGT